MQKNNKKPQHQSFLLTAITGAGLVRGKSAQEIQDEIFRKMSADKKIKLTFAMSNFCLKLNNLNGRNKSVKTPYSSNSGIR